MTDQEYMEGLATYLNSTRFGLVGSTYIAGHGNDVDMLFLVPDLIEAAAFLQRKGWECQSEQYDETNQFMSFKADRYNALCTSDLDFFVGFLTSAEVCKYLYNYPCDVRQRSCRVALHKIIRDGKNWDEAQRSTA